MEKIWGVPNSVQNEGFCYFLKAALLVFLDIAQNCSLKQCVTSSRAETSIKHFSGPNWGRNDLFYSNFTEHPLILTCLNQFRIMKGTETNPTSDKLAIIPSAVEKCFLIMLS